MSLLASYLRRQYKLLLLLAGFFCIFAAVFSLYTLPVEAVAYAGLLCFLLGLALFAVGYACFRSRHRELQRLLRQVQEKVLPLPPARGCWRRTISLWSRPFAATGQDSPWKMKTACGT